MNQPSYENVLPEALEPGDVIFLARADREILTVEYREHYTFPGFSPKVPELRRPAYLLTLKGWKGTKVYRPGAIVTRRKRSDAAA